MNSLTDRIHRILARRPFAVLGYSAEDDTYCPTCLHITTGLTPNAIDTNGKPVLSLYLRDPHVHQERCSTCDAPLLDLLPGLAPPKTLEIRRRIQLENSTIVRYEIVGRLELYEDGRGTLVTNLLEDAGYLFEGEPLPVPVAHEPVVAKPPTIRRHA